MKLRHKHTINAFEAQQGGAVLIAILLVACLLLGLAAGFTVRALTGERKPAAGSGGNPRVNEQKADVVGPERGHDYLAPETSLVARLESAASAPCMRDGSLPSLPAQGIVEWQ
ncbi:MAG: hypothetical protein ACYC99_02440 [Candidatus Geothermincolia bacterium]